MDTKTPEFTRMPPPLELASGSRTGSRRPHAPTWRRCGVTAFGKKHGCLQPSKVHRGFSGPHELHLCERKHTGCNSQRPRSKLPPRFLSFWRIRWPVVAAAQVQEGQRTGPKPLKSRAPFFIGLNRLKLGYCAGALCITAPFQVCEGFYQLS